MCLFRSDSPELEYVDPPADRSVSAVHHAVPCMHTDFLGNRHRSNGHRSGKMPRTCFLLRLYRSLRVGRVAQLRRSSPPSQSPRLRPPIVALRRHPIRPTSQFKVCEHSTVQSQNSDPMNNKTLSTPAFHWIRMCLRSSGPAVVNPLPGKSLPWCRMTW